MAIDAERTPGPHRLPQDATEVPRPRLNARLESATAACVVLCAPAGYGKSLLAASWIRHQPEPATAWVDVSRVADSAPRFWSAVITAVLEAHPECADDLGRLLPAAVVAPAEAAIGLARWQPPCGRHTVVVLDDFHGVVDAAIHEQFLELLSARPTALRCVVLTRHDPPWPLHRLRLDGLVDELRAAELAFDVREAAALFDASGLDLDDATVIDVHAHTEGWAAGLRLAALGALGAPDPAEYLRGVTGREDYIADYLLREVYDALDPAWREFAARVGMVDEVCASLAEALGGGPDSDRLLRTLAARNAFLHERVDRPGWYRLHPLLLDFLRSRTTDRADAAEVHARAARWYDRQEMDWLALEHAVRAADWDLVSDLVGRHLIRWTVRQPPGDLMGVLERVPREALLTHAGLAIGLAGARAMSAQPDGIDDLLVAGRAAVSDAPADARDRLTFLAELIDVGVGRFTGNLRTTLAGYLRMPMESADLAPLGLSDWTAVQTLLLSNTGSAELWLGDLESARTHLTDATRDVPGREVSMPLLNAHAHLAYLLWMLGELTEAEIQARRAVEGFLAWGIADATQSKTAHLALAGVAIDRDEPAEAARRLADAQQIPGEAHTDFAAALLAARLDAVEGRTVDAVAGLRAGRAAEQPGVTPFLLARSLGLEAHLQRLLGNDDEAGALVAQARRLVGAAATREDRRVRVQRHVRRARTAWLAGAQDAALADIELALDDAAVVGFRSPFVESAAEIIDLVGTRVEQGTGHRDFALDLLGRMAAPAAGSRTVGSLLLIPLSERESYVMRYLVTNLTVPEIADALFVSVNTVKTHQRSIYRKLGASSRREAVDHARQLGLV